MNDRDFAGYRWRYPDLRWPNGARLAISFVLNVEEGAEFSLGAGDPRNEEAHEVTHEIRGARDYCMESHFEYGARVGYWRITRRFLAHGLPLTLNACARALEATPWVAEDAVAQGFEICCHGWRWESHAGMPEQVERETIARSVETIRRLSGRAPAGWHTKSSRSGHTRRLLHEHGGFLYDSDDYSDDLPYTLTRPDGGRHVVLPYAFDTNDMRFFNMFAFVRGGDFAAYCGDAIDWMLQEAQDSPRLLSIGLHTRIMGRPARIGGLERVLQQVSALGERVWVATREDVARHWLASTA